MSYPTSGVFPLVKDFECQMETNASLHSVVGFPCLLQQKARSGKSKRLSVCLSVCLSV